MWAPHLNLSFVSSAYIHPFTGNDAITIGWRQRDPFRACLAVHALVWEHAHSLATWHEVCVFHLLSIELLDDCQMLWTWPEEPCSWQHHSVIGHHMNVVHAFLESIEILSNDYQEECTFSSVADHTFSRTPKRILHPFLHEHISPFLERPEGKQKVLCTMQ
jgi:hypothetical protein